MPFLEGMPNSPKDMTKKEEKDYLKIVFFSQKLKHKLWKGSEYWKSSM